MQVTNGQYGFQSDSDWPTISVVTVVRNRVHTIERAMCSVLEQKYPHLEYIVIDGGSTDGTAQIVERYNDQITRWVSEPDRGIFDAMNKGIRLCTGQIVGLLNSDDWYEPGALFGVAEAVKKNPEVQMYYGQANIRLSDGNILRVWPNRRRQPAWLGIPFDHQSCFFRRSVYENLGLFNIVYRTAADYDFLLRFLRAGYLCAPVEGVTNNFSLGGISSESFWPPFGDIWRILRTNGYHPAVAALGTGLRIVKLLGGTIASFGRRLLIRNGQDKC
jgi:glycosyltransferase involved in cell wall biosynthesis